MPEFRADLILPLLPSAVTVALLAAVESLLSAVVADSLIGDRHNSNAELLAQGVANVLVPMVGGIPVTGAIARTATNFRSGGRTPVAGIVHALTLLAFVLLLAPLAVHVPLADAWRGAVRRRLEHGRVARDPVAAAARAAPTRRCG